MTGFGVSFEILRYSMKASDSFANCCRASSRSFAFAVASAYVAMASCFAMRAADQLLAFLARAAPWLGLIKGVRYTSVMGHPFHVMDRRVVILSVDHPLAPERRIASLWIEDPPLAAGLAAGFDALWQKAMKHLREIRGIPLQGGG